MRQDLIFSGVMPANLLPFTSDYAIDERNYRRHLQWLADIPGVTGIVVNGHAAEVSSLQRDERRRALAMALDTVGSQLPLITGIYTDNTLEAVELAREAQADGAKGLLIFPPTLFMWGAQLRPEMPYRHFAMIADAVDLPFVVFQYPPASGIGGRRYTIRQTQPPGTAQRSNHARIASRNGRTLLYVCSSGGSDRIAAANADTRSGRAVSSCSGCT